MRLHYRHFPFILRHGSFSPPLPLAHPFLGPLFYRMAMAFRLRISHSFPDSPGHDPGLGPWPGNNDLPDGQRMDAASAPSKTDLALYIGSDRNDHSLRGNIMGLHRHTSEGNPFRSTLSVY